MFYVIKTRLTATTGRTITKKYIDSAKATRYFKNHVDHSMEVCIYDDNMEIVACYRFSSGMFSNVSDEFAKERGYHRQHDIKDSYYVAIINSDLTISVKEFKSYSLTDMYYEENNYEEKGGRVCAAYHSATTWDDDRIKERIITERFNNKLLDESTIIVNRNNGSIIDVFFFREEYNTNDNIDKVQRLYYERTCNTSENDKLNDGIRYFYSKLLNIRCKIERLYTQELAEEFYARGDYIWIFPKCLDIGSGFECRVGGPDRLFPGRSGLKTAAYRFKDSIKGLKSQDLMFFRQIGGSLNDNEK